MLMVVVLKLLHAIASGLDNAIADDIETDINTLTSQMQLQLNGPEQIISLCLI